MSLQNVQTLKASIMDVIQDEQYDVEDLIKLLSPLDKYVSNKEFISNLSEVISVILEDRDGNNKFTIKDLELLKKDIIEIINLMSGLFLVLASIPKLKLKYDGQATEELVFKLLLYVFIIIIPKEINKPWSYDEKERIVDLTITVYQVIVSSQITKNIVSNVAKWFKKKGWCSCICGDDDAHKERVVKQRLPLIKAEITSTVQNNKDKVRLQSEIDELRVEIRKLKKNDELLEISI